MKRTALFALDVLCWAVIVVGALTLLAAVFHG